MELFEKRKYSVIFQFNENCIDSEITIGQTQEDVIRNVLTAKMSTWLNERQLQNVTKTYWFKRPTFLDWLLRRKMRAQFEINVSEILLRQAEKDCILQIDVKPV